MSDSDTSGFAKFVPGFDFLQNLAKSAGAGTAQIPGLSHWVAPTLNVEELDKRIGELKNVQFWLEQNSRALAATIQALEVQKMTLATLKGMNFNMGEMAKAFGINPQGSGESVAAAQPAREEPKAPPAAQADTPAAGAQTPSAEDPVAPKLADPLQLWGSLAQQFQHIAAGVLKQVASPDTADAKKPTAAKRKAAKSGDAPAPRPTAKRRASGTARKPASGSATKKPVRS